MLRDLPASEWPVNRMQHHGAGALSNVELLAAILQTPDAISLANELLAKFHSTDKLARASIDELCQVRGVGRARATRLKATLELARRLFVARLDEYPQITSPADAANLIMNDMAALEQEELWVLLLDVKNRVQRTTKLYRGSTNASMVRVGEVFRDAIRANATAIIVAHNHPSGDPTPSPEDVLITRQINSAGKITDIALLDHIIIGYNRFISLKERGLGFDA